MLPLAVFQKGELRSKFAPPGKLLAQSAANFEISNADFSDFNEQVSDTLLFLRENRESLVSIRSFPGVEGVVLDFAVEIDPERFPCSFNFPDELLVSAGSLGISLELSIYPD